MTRVKGNVNYTSGNASSMLSRVASKPATGVDLTWDDAVLCSNEVS